ncbi:MmpS family transport accessory protein [Mycobacteroides immunogenum]|uniref:MmpS family transport accessory protein n=1 Tax=Mycobacteroides immunogenum TaxID=83262 RepID=UPI003F4A0A14
MVLLKLLRRVWLPLIIALVIGVGGLAVMGIRTQFGGERAHLISPRIDDTKPFNPKVVTYEVHGEPGATADINYLDLDARPQRLERVPLPWSMTLSTTVSSVAPNLLAQGHGSEIECSISVNQTVKDRRTFVGTNAMTFCTVKSA